MHIKQYHDNGDAFTYKEKYTALLQQELQNPYWCLHHPVTTKSYINRDGHSKNATCHVFFQQH